MNTEDVTPTMERIGSLKVGDCFWKKRDRSLYTIMKQNCYECKIREDGKITVYNLSLNLISHIDANEWVILAYHVKIETQTRKG